jgi:mono/diheme cytochrome c family protein
MSRPLRLLPLAALPLGAVLLIACGSQGVEVSTSAANLREGAEIFSQRCSGCHTLSAAGAEGSATNIADTERTDGPSFDERKERSVSDVAYAIRNGGFSGAIMPQNIVVGPDVQKVAAFVVACSGKDAKQPPGPNALPNTPPAKACNE